MRRKLLDILSCPVCRGMSFYIKDAAEDRVEIRQGHVVCEGCGVIYRIKHGIIDFLIEPSPEVTKEKEAIEKEEYFQDLSGVRYSINRDTIEMFREQLLTLPDGDGSALFKRGGPFQSLKEGAHRFYDTFRKMGIRKGDCILNLGDGFGYASYRFAQAGAYVVALDIGKYLLAGDLYVKDAYFERVFSDMHSMPFKDNSFDAVFCSAVLHHSRYLRDVFLEIHRVLKREKIAFIINESSRGILERADNIFDELNRRGYSDTAYTIPEWITAARQAGFNKLSVEFLSLADDYITRQNNKGKVVLTPALRLAYFLKAHRYIERSLLFLTRWLRILFRPKSWRMVCWK